MKPYIIADTAYTHERDFDYILKMIEEIGRSKVSAIKFHILMDLETYFQKNHPLIPKMSDLLFNLDQWNKIIQKSKDIGLDVVVLCDDIASFNYVLNNNKIDQIEIHAVSINDIFMLEEAAKFKGKVILGIGGCTFDEIDFAINFLRAHGKNEIMLMFGFQNYPTNYKNINISKMRKSASLYDGIEMGYADHTSFDDENNILISAIGAANGFNILEKHFTLEEGIERLDYHAAVGKEKFIKIYETMEILLLAYGNGTLKMSENEKNYGKIGPMKKAIVARKKINKGEKISLEKLCFKRTTQEAYIEQRKALNLVGLEAIEDIFEDEIISYAKIKYEFKPLKEEDFTNIKKKGEDA